MPPFHATHTPTARANFVCKPCTYTRHTATARRPHAAARLTSSSTHKLCAASSAQTTHAQECTAPGQEQQRPAGLLTIASTDAGTLRVPGDFQKMAWTALRRAEHRTQQALVDSQDASVHRSTHQLTLIHEAEKALVAVMRPARYCRDFHPDPAWRQAAEEANTTAAAALAELHGRVDVHSLLRSCEQHIDTAAFEQASLHTAAITGKTQAVENRADAWATAECAQQTSPHRTEAAADRQAAAGAPVGSNRQRREGLWGPWQRACQTLVSAWDRGLASKASSPTHLALLRQHERQCAAALRQLLSDPSAAPRLQLHPEQARLLETWMGRQLRGQSAAHNQPPQQAGGPSSADPPAAAPVSKGIAEGAEGHRQLLLYGEVWLDLAELDTATEEAAAAETENQAGKAAGEKQPVAQHHQYQHQQQHQQQQQQQQSRSLEDDHKTASQQPVTVVLPLSVAEVLLRHHPSEGVRWQVYTSCTVPLARLALVAVAQLTALRNEIAQEQGHTSHAHATLDGSILGSPEAAITFLSGFCTGLHDYAASDLRDLCRMARRAGMCVHEPRAQHAAVAESAVAPSGFMPLDPWNVDYLTARAAELQATPKTPRSAGTGWHQFRDYFTVGSVLQGMHTMLWNSMRVGLVPDPNPITAEDCSLVGAWREPGHSHHPDSSSGSGSRDDQVEHGKDSHGHHLPSSSNSSSSSSGGEPGKSGGQQHSSEHKPATVGCYQGEGGVLVRLLVQHEHHHHHQQHQQHEHHQYHQQQQQRQGGSVPHVGVVYLHLHTQGQDYPFTTLLQHAAQGSPATPLIALIRMGLPTRSQSSSSSSSSSSSRPGSRLGIMRDEGEGFSLEQPLSAWQLPLRVEHPFFLRVLWHEMGHALHYVLSELPLGTCAEERGVQEQASTTARSTTTTTTSGTMSESVSSAPEAAFSSSIKAGALLPPPLPPSLRSAQHCPVDWREAGPHLFERWATEPAVLRLMSRHLRLGVPLPPRDASRCSVFLSALSQASVIELTELAAGALADQLLHVQLAGSPVGDTAGSAAIPLSHQQHRDPSTKGSPQQQQQQQQQQQERGSRVSSGQLAASQAPVLELRAWQALRLARWQGQVVLGGGWPAPLNPNSQLQRHSHQQQHNGQQQQQQHGYLNDQTQETVADEGGLCTTLEACPEEHRAAGMQAHSQQQVQDARAQKRVVVQPVRDPDADAIFIDGLAVEPLAVNLEALAMADAQAVVGGAQVAYVLTKLIAAAAWRAHLEHDPLCPTGGRAIRKLLLERGGHASTPQQAVTDLLGEGALKPVRHTPATGVQAEHAGLPTSMSSTPDAVEGSLTGMRSAGGVGAAVSGASAGWVPDLGNDAWQDIDLLR